MYSLATLKFVLLYYDIIALDIIESRSYIPWM